ncbi:type 1 glutamine amidotransferase [Maridesulfovibrio salexigens]|uniref:Glutamine amidotransferase class-I n=1 Tax=Maridesulfovibrio salexigens (strain ATCC 14822 / DSM 2638 / NCIMB 8403 / VKM B-1763) TaxID=526222 RepID=C6C2A6_MARSD|nr:glutamine amidotransferase [Maridesulfovibrio salexigens]ACS81307.1 glutamine amidotransferase class-I [Maridesulfovibrio salexigens DSM 2638]
MKNKRVLVLNILGETAFKISFDNRVAEVFQSLGITYDTVYLADIADVSEIESYTHLLISGSEASVTEEHCWDSSLDSIIRSFIATEKSILGLCFGHQFLIRHILGKDHVRKSQTPEVGWTDISISGNPIFSGAPTLKSAVLHFDEICDLDERFEIIAKSNRCDIQGFQMKGKHIWGLQFHPDFMYEDIDKFTGIMRDNVTNFEEIHCQTPVSCTEFAKNDEIFKNWIEIS